MKSALTSFHRFSWISLTQHYLEGIFDVSKVDLVLRDGIKPDLKERILREAIHAAYRKLIAHRHFISNCNQLAHSPPPLSLDPERTPKRCTSGTSPLPSEYFRSKIMLKCIADWD